MTCGDRDQDIMVRWKELLDKLESRKSTLSGFNSLMAMFREIESIQEELKEVQVGVATGGSLSFQVQRNP